VTAALDGWLAVVIEMPIDALKSVRRLVFVGQGIVEGKVYGQLVQVRVFVEISEDRSDEGQSYIVGFPGADAEEIGEVAGINAIALLLRELCQCFASWCDDEEVGAAFEMAHLWQGECQAEESEEGDDSGGTVYDSFHGSRRGRTGKVTTVVLFPRPSFSCASVQAFRSSAQNSPESSSILTSPKRKRGPPSLALRAG
jgi:hypothetical protein